MNISVTCITYYMCGRCQSEYGRHELESGITTLNVESMLCPKCGRVPKVVIKYFSRLSE